MVLDVCSYDVGCFNQALSFGWCMKFGQKHTIPFVSEPWNMYVSKRMQHEQVVYIWVRFARSWPPPHGPYI